MASHLEPGRMLKHYRIVSLLGRGGMGEVYAADDTRLGRKVAIKILPPALAGDAERLRRFTQEAKAASALNHPSILTIHDVDEMDGHPFLVTEFIEGQTLRERLRRQVLSLRDAVEIAGQVASALSAAHAAGIVHRDVKPENIMLREDGHAKLVDFGLAKIAFDDATGSTDETVAAVGPQTTPGIVMGTTAYMSPEQARGLPVDARSDIFSLGVVLYEMAAGRPPFQGETPSDVIAAILHFEPPALPDLPPELEHTLRKALEKDRDERHQTAKDLAADLKRLRRRLDPSAGALPTPAGQNAAASAATPPATSAPKAELVSGATPKRSTRVRLVVGALAVATIVGVIAVAWTSGVRRWLGRDAATTTATGVGDFGSLTVERVTGLGDVEGQAISRDGKLLAYVKNEGTERTIWLRQMATGSVVKVVGPTPNTLSNIEFTPDGNFLYYNENTLTRPIRYVLKAVPAFGGAARDVVEARFWWRPSFAPDGKRFVAVRETPNAWQLVVMNADGTGTPSVIASRPRGGQIEYIDPRWSPSGNHVAVVANQKAESGSQTNIQIMRPDGSEVRTITPSVVYLQNLVWTASDDALVGIGGLKGGSAAQLLLIRTSDGGVKPLTNDAQNHSSLSFSPASGTFATVQSSRLGSIWTGPVERPEAAVELPTRLSEQDGYLGLSWLNDREIVFTRAVDGHSLWIRNTDGTAARRLTADVYILFPRASKDGRQVLFEGVLNEAPGQDLYRMTLPEGRVVRLTRENGTTSVGMSPDGRTVFFTRLADSPPKLLSMPADGGSVTPVFEAATIFGYDVSRDGTRVAVIANSGVGTPRTLNVIPVGGGPPRTLLTSVDNMFGVRWYPSGDALLLLIAQNLQVNMFRLDLAGGPPRQLTHFTRGVIDHAEISPDGRRIAYHRGTVESDIVLVKPKTN